MTPEAMVICSTMYCTCTIERVFCNLADTCILQQVSDIPRRLYHVKIQFEMSDKIVKMICGTYNFIYYKYFGTDHVLVQSPLS